MPQDYLKQEPKSKNPFDNENSAKACYLDSFSNEKAKIKEEYSGHYSKFKKSFFRDNKNTVIKKEKCRPAPYKCFSQSWENMCIDLRKKNKPTLFFVISNYSE